MTLGSDCTKRRLRVLHRLGGTMATLRRTETGTNVNQIHATDAFLTRLRDSETETARKDRSSFARNLPVTFMLLLV